MNATSSAAIPSPIRPPKQYPANKIHRLIASADHGNLERNCCGIVIPYLLNSSSNLATDSISVSISSLT